MVGRLLLLVAALCIICVAASEPVSQITQSDADAFLAWMKQKNPVDICLFTLAPVLSTDVGYLGLVKAIATVDLPINTSIYSFSDKFNFYKNNEANQDTIDMLYLVHEKKNGKESEWAPYINILPKTFSTPVFWSPEEHKELEGTSIYDSITRLNNTIRKEYKELIENKNFTTLFSDMVTPPDVPEQGVFTIRDWMWAYSIFRSKNWKTPLGSKISPVLELFNYGKKSNVKLGKKEDGWVEITATEDIRAGEPIIINDGLIGNRELLDWYGFVIPKNVHDYIPVGVGLDPDENLYGMKKDYLRRRGLKEGQTYQLQDDLIPRALVYALRIYHLSVYDHDHANNAVDDKLISAQNEMSVCNTLIDMSTSSLENLKHTLKEDKALLKTGVSNNLRSAIILRRAEKKILMSILKLAKLQLEDVKKHWDKRSYEVPSINNPRP